MDTYPGGRSQPTGALRRIAAVTAAAVSIAVMSPAGSDAGTKPRSAASRLVASLESGAGSTIGPDGALYVTQPTAGKVARIDRRTGKVTTYVDGLPPLIQGVGVGGAMDIIFRKGVGYVLVTLVGADVGGSDVVGIYRVDGRHKTKVVADLGAFNLANPPDSEFFVPTGLQYAMENVPGGIIVSDGHLNRVLKVSDKGVVTVLRSFGNIVPTGLETSGAQIWMAEAGAVPHSPQDGKVTTFSTRKSKARHVAAGGRLLVDVELGKHGTLYALAQGVWPLGGDPGSPATPDTGKLLRKNGRGFDTVAKGLDRPTSVEIVGDTAYVVTMDGEIWTVDLHRHHHR